jgi:hypothetical protein
LLFGLCVAQKTHWIGPAVGYAMQAFGVVAISNVAVTYSLEMYKPVSALNFEFPFRCTTDSGVGNGRGSSEHFHHPQYYWHASLPVRSGLD